MGAGCSSPLRRLAAKKNKSSRRESSLSERLEPGNNNGGNNNNNNNNGGQSQPGVIPATAEQSQQLQPKSFTPGRLNLEKEITVQSEIAEDQPSTASYYTDGRVHYDEAKTSEQSASLEPRSYSSLAGSAAKFMGLSGGFSPHDRHLLVSPALSPAPSTCYSPSPAGTVVGSTSHIDLADLNEAFKSLTFGFYGTAQKIKPPERQQSLSADFFTNCRTHQLIQMKPDLTMNISVIFIESDSFHSDETRYASQTSPSSIHQADRLRTGDSLAEQIEINLKSLCDEHGFNLRFLNLSQSHLSERLHINNLIDASMRLFKQEYQENGQRLIVLLFTGNKAPTDPVDGESVKHPSQPFNAAHTKQLPTVIESQAMTRLLSKLDEAEGNSAPSKEKDLFKRWYNQVAGVYYLNPIYLVNSKILSRDDAERRDAWISWLGDAKIMIEAISRTSLADGDLNLLRSMFKCQLEFLTQEQALHKRTLLIRNTPTISATSAQHTLANPQAQRKSYLHEITRLLADPNKLTLKRPLESSELNETIIDWICDNVAKFIDAILDGQVALGKHVPPFIERNLFVELTCQRHCLEHYLDNIGESFESKCISFYSSQIGPILEDVARACSNGESAMESSTVSGGANRDSEVTGISQAISSNHLVFISGPQGCGKSTLFAQLIKLAAQEFSNKIQIIYRFCGRSQDSLKPMRLLRSICEQFCQTQGENITAASYIYSARNEVMQALNKIIQTQSSLIFIDGLDSLVSQNEEELNWFCELNSSPRLRIFVTLETDSDFYKQALCSYADATFISLDHPTPTEWAQMLSTAARSHRLNSASNLYDEIKKAQSADLNTARKSKQVLLATNYENVSDILATCRIRKLNNEGLFPELSPKNMQDIESVHQTALQHLGYLCDQQRLACLLFAIYLSRDGLTVSDLSSILQHHKGHGTRFSYTSLQYLLIHLQPWLKTIICDSQQVKLSLKRHFLQSLVQQLVGTKQADSSQPLESLESTRKLLLDYFSTPNQVPVVTRKRPSRVSVGPVNLATLERRGKVDLVASSERAAEGEFSNREQTNPSERRWLATQSSEIANLLIADSNQVEACKYLLNKKQFFAQFLYSCMPEEFIEDYERLRSGTNSTNWDDSMKCLNLLATYIRQSVYPLRYSGSQIYSQIYCRAFEIIKLERCKDISVGSEIKSRAGQDKDARTTSDDVSVLLSRELNDILATSSCPPIRSLLPVSETSVNSFIKARIGQQTTPARTQMQQVSATTTAVSSGSSINVPPSSATSSLPRPALESLHPSTVPAVTTSTPSNTIAVSTTNATALPPQGPLSSSSGQYLHHVPTVQQQPSHQKLVGKSSGGYSVSQHYQLQQQLQQQQASKQRIFTIKHNYHQMIVIYPDKGMLSVWDLFEERVVKTISQLDQPRDLRMIDKQRAVILCNRELRVYDLETGNLLTKLKGVMNQKMPFFEVFGENYVIALARNRMYVNMLNVNTGELETTFKVGEDRFLNSLLVSANGGICVCGDETQKPFPLLVWNLNERRLMYDLRLERHEFITSMSAISDDGHFVVSVCRQLGDANTSDLSASNITVQQQGGGGTSSNGQGSPSSGLVATATSCSAGNSTLTGGGAGGEPVRKSSPNFIVVYDLSSGTLFKKWKPGSDSCAVAISIADESRSGKVINSIADSSMLVWDLATGSKRHTLRGHSAPADVIRVQNNRLFSMDSTCRDQSLRIWNIEEGCCLAVFSPDAPVSCCQMSIDGEALVCAFAGDARLSTLLMCKSETVANVLQRYQQRRESTKSFLFGQTSSE